MKKVIVRLVLLATLFLTLFILFRYTPLGDYFSLAEISRQRDSLLTFVEERYALFVLLFILTYIAVVAFSIPGATVLSVSGGFFFGPLIGVIFINIGAVVGALLVFLAARLILGSTIQEKYTDKLTQFNREMEKNGSSYLLTLRLIPVFPFFLINLLAGVTAVKAFTFVWTTALGIIPGSFVFAYLGHAGASLEPGGASFPTEALLALVLLGLLSLIPVVIRKMKQKKEIPAHDNP